MDLGGRRQERSVGHMARKHSMREAQDRFVALIAQGHTVISACHGVGRSEKTYYMWRDKYPGFAIRVDMARAAKGDPSLKGIDFIRHRQLYFERDTPAHHMQMISAIEGAPPDSITMILAPPESAKTSLAVDYVCWKLSLDPNFRVAIVSESDDLAKKILAQIARRMTDPVSFGPFIDAYGPFRATERADNKPWNAHAITLLRSSHDEKEPSVETKGATGQIYGARYDLLLLDDIQSTTNLGETEKLVNHFRQTMLSRVSREKGKTIILGSRVDRGDFYERLLDEEAQETKLVDDLVQIRALDDDGRSYWPGYWSVEALERRRNKVGPAAWARAYMQTPAMIGTPTFSESMLEACKDPALSMGSLLPVGQKVVCAVDPALTGFTAMVALAYDANHAWLLDVEAWEHLGRTEEIQRHMEAFTMRYRPQRWVVEIGAFQGSLFGDQRLQEMSRRFGFELTPHATNRNKADPSLGVGSMASSWSLKEITVPYGDETTRIKADAFHRELLAWRPNVPTRLIVQDRVMAAWFAWRVWMAERRFFEPKLRVERRPDWVGSDLVRAS